MVKEGLDRKFYYTTLILTIVFLVTMSIILPKDNVQRSGKVEVQQTYTLTNLPELTKNLIHRSDAYLNVENKVSLQDITKIAQTRQQVLIQTLEKNPKEAAKYMLSQELINKIPTEARQYVEEIVNLQGTVEIIHKDNFDEEISEEDDYLILDDETRVRIYQVNEEPLPPEQKINIKGYRLGNNILIADSKTEIVRLSPQTLELDVSKKGLQPVIPEEEPEIEHRKVAIILVNFIGDQMEPYTLEEMRQYVYGTEGKTLNSFFKESSLNTVDFVGYFDTAGDIFGYYTLDSSGSFCENYDSWRFQVNPLAMADGFDINNYDHVSYIYFGSEVNCQWGGVGQVNGKITWMNGMSWVNQDVEHGLMQMSHEFGHNFGAHHANLIRCTADDGTPVTISNNCIQLEYGDNYDSMGIPYWRHFNSFTKSELSFIPSDNVINVLDSGTFTISTMEKESDLPQLIKIRRPGITNTLRDYIYVEARENYGFDSYNIYNPRWFGIGDGIFIRLAGNEIYQSWLIDATPGESWYEAFLVGNTFEDTLSGVSVTLLNRTEDTATVQVNIGESPEGCTRAAPELQIIPTSKWGFAGETTSFSVYVTNMDSVGCTSSNFDISIALPEGLTADTTLTPIINPQETWDYRLDILADPQIEFGAHDFTITAINTRTSMSDTETVTLSTYQVDDEDPVVIINEPSDGFIIPSKGFVDISATASDSSGILRMDILVNGAVWSSCSYVDTCSDSFKSTDFPVGTNTITIRAVDASAYRNTVERTITGAK